MRLLFIIFPSPNSVREQRAKFFAQQGR